MFCDVFLCFVMFMLWSYYILKLLRLETITFSDATLRDINVVLCYVLSQYRIVHKCEWRIGKVSGWGFLEVIGLSPACVV
jgi:hypothetical protein